MAFHPGEILVFDHGGHPLGVIRTWTTVLPRSHRIGATEDWKFLIPLYDNQGNVVYDAAMALLLTRDNIVYIADEQFGVPGWGGAISNVVEGNERVEVSMLGGASLLSKVDTTGPVKQTVGTSDTLAQHLISEANAKKGGNGDIQLGFVADGSTPVYGTITFDGDIYQGLTQIATETLAEWWCETILGPGGSSIGFTIHWDKLVTHHHESIVIHDGVGGQLKSGTQVQYSGLEMLNAIRLKGQPTHLSDFLTYPCIQSIVHDITPEVDFTVPPIPGARYSEDLSLSVNFGLSDDAQRKIAWDIQQLYLDYYRTYLYAHHTMEGKPFLDGYDWSGPDGTNDSKLTERFFRSFSYLASFGAPTVVTAPSEAVTIVGGVPTTDPVLTTAGSVSEWVPDTTIALPGIVITGMATDVNTNLRWVADAATGNLLTLQPDNLTTSIWGLVAVAGETLLSVAQSATDAQHVIVLVSVGSAKYVRIYNVDTLALVSQYQLPSGLNALDIAAVGTSLYVVGSGDSNIHTIDALTGAAIALIPAGLVPSAISTSGGMLYVAATTGAVRILFPNGSSAGSLSIPSGVTGLFADPTGGHVYTILPNGTAASYHAFVAVGSSTGPTANLSAGAPGFDLVQGGQYIHIVMTDDEALLPKGLYFMVYTVASWTPVVTIGAIGSPDTTQLVWTIDPAGQVVGHVNASGMVLAPPNIVILGEEGRVCDWDPKRDGYGELKDQWFRTNHGRLIDHGPGWYIKPWDIPDSKFEPPPKPGWPEGQAAAAAYLAKKNREASIQSIVVTNADGLWGSIQLGGIYTLNVTKQGPRPGGISLAIRVIAFSPHEFDGTLELVSEVFT